MKTRIMNAKQNNTFWRIFAIATLIVFFIIGFMNSCSNRYRPIADSLVLDSWTGKVYDIDGNLFKIPK